MKNLTETNQFSAWQFSTGLTEADERLLKEKKLFLCKNITGSIVAIYNTFVTSNYIYRIYSPYVFIYVLIELRYKNV